MSWVKYNAAGDPISDIIGEYIGEIQLNSEHDFSIGLSMNQPHVEDCIGASLLDFMKAAAKDAATPGVLPWDVGRTKAQNQRLAEVHIRFNRGEQPSERGGKRVHKGGFSLAEVNAAVAREKMYRAYLQEHDPAALAKRVAYFQAEKDKAHGHRMRNRGFNPIRSISRGVKSITNPLTKPIGRAANTVIDKVPLARDVVNLASTEATLFLTAPRFLAGASKGLVTGGLKGAARGIKDEAAITAREGRRYIQSPIIRYGTKGAAVLFPALTPVAAGVEAANQLIAAVEGKDPIKAALAVGTIANTVAAANGGDLEALRAVKTIKAVKDGVIPSSLGKVLPNMAKPLFTIAKGATGKQAIAAAHSILTIAKGQGNLSPSAVKAAQSVIKNTISAAKTGNVKAKAGAVVLAKVHKAQKDAFRKKPPTKRGSYRKAERAAKGKRFAGAFLVDSRGRVLKGNFAAQ